MLRKRLLRYLNITFRVDLLCPSSRNDSVPYSYNIVKMAWGNRVKSKRRDWFLHSVQLHMMIFILAVFAGFYGVFAEILYPGNVTVPASVWRSVAADRLSTLSILFFIYGLHVALYLASYVYRRWQRRRYDQFIYHSQNEHSQPNVTRLIDDSSEQEAQKLSQESSVQSYLKN